MTPPGRHLPSTPSSSPLPFAPGGPDQTPASALRWSKKLTTQRYLRLLDRVAQMSLGEVRTRLWLPVRKYWSVLGARYGFAQHASPHRSAVFLQALGAQPQARLAAWLDQRFFFGPSHQQRLCGQIAQHVPAATRRVAAAAAAFEQQGLDLLGQRVRLVAGEIDWQADPHTSQRTWGAAVLDEGDAVSVTGADVKYVWEINRQQFLTTLGRAFWFTGEPRYARGIVELVRDWIEQNPAGRGVNWSSPLEVAMRAISWLWTMPYVLA